MIAARCPQWWAIFSVRGDTGTTYEVRWDDILQGTWRCTCRAFIFGGRISCKHIDRVVRHGCFGGGPNDLSVGVEITGENPTRATTPTQHKCACGAMMLEPLLRMQDENSRQVVQVQFDGGTYRYAWAGHPLAVGDGVRGGTVVALGSDYTGELKVISQSGGMAS